MKPWLILLLLVAPPAAHAQSIAQSRAAFALETRSPAPSSLGRDSIVEWNIAAPTSVLVAGGLAGLGLWSAWMAAAIRNCGEYDFHCLVVPLAQPLATPIGVHVANRARGSLGGSIGRSYLVAGLGLIAGATLGAEEAHYGWPITMAVISAAQLAIAVAMETKTTSVAPSATPKPAILTQEDSSDADVPARPSSIPRETTHNAASLPRIVGGAVLGFAAASVPLAMSLAICDNADCGADILAAIAVQPFGAPVGAHMANRSRGSLGMSIGASFAVTVIGGAVLLAIAGSNSEDAVALSIPIMQVLLSTVIERGTTSTPR